ncbi:sodium-dependent transporter [Bacilliculturomica massiliensis]|uniref:sodium-dependent transporter n=1 Tax=Bacilliculturomica massiliensis TaxID=1917867 RepID=UPI001031A294|nr:sodium-dependent transporter [Bacilliculturomica massiliensis]
MPDNKQREGFGSMVGFLLTILGFAIGEGSFWRFPYMCGSNGGALFIITYLIVVVVIGIPLLTAEISMGYVTQKTALGAYKTLKPNTKWYYAGYLHMVVAVLINSYIIPVYAWVLTYVYRTATGFFVGLDASEIEASFHALNTDYKTMFIFALFFWACMVAVISRGVQSGLERANKFMLPAIGIIMIICIVMGLTIDGAEKGVEFMFRPNTDGFTFNSITSAVGQAFFAIGIGMLASMVFGSYIKNKNENIVKQSTIICFGIIFAGLAAGMMIFPMVFAFGLEPNSGTGLSMITLPNVFNHIAGGRVIGTLFYISFFFATLSTAIGIAEAIVAEVMNRLDWSRKKALTVVMFATMVIGSLAILIPGFLDRVDIITGNYLLVISGFVIDIFVGWIWGVESFLDAINVKNRVLRMWVGYSVKYICPVAIIVIFTGNFL